MAVSASWYGKGLHHFTNKEIDWDSDVVKVALVKSTYTPNQDTHEFWSDVVAHEVAAGGGYATGGITLANRARIYDAPTNEERLDADDAVWGPNVTFTLRYAVVYQSTGANGTSILLGWVDLGDDVPVSSSTLTLNWHSSGVLKLGAV